LVDQLVAAAVRPREGRDEDVVLGVEVVVDGAGGGPRLARDVRDAGRLEAEPDDRTTGGLEDLLGARVGPAQRRERRASPRLALAGRLDS
jgi:hypothetical protein